MLEFNGKLIETDKDGYLMNCQDWTPELIDVIAKANNIILNDEHLEIIFFVRDFYLEYQTSPAIRMLVKALAQKLGADKGNSRYLHRLFPDGPAKQATKLAGLPKPVKCI